MDQNIEQADQLTDMQENNNDKTVDQLASLICQLSQWNQETKQQADYNNNNNSEYDYNNSNQVAFQVRYTEEASQTIYLPKWKTVDDLMQQLTSRCKRFFAPNCEIAYLPQSIDLSEPPTNQHNNNINNESTISPNDNVDLGVYSYYSIMQFIDNRHLDYTVETFAQEFGSQLIVVLSVPVYISSERLVKETNSVYQDFTYYKHNKLRDDQLIYVRIPTTIKVIHVHQLLLEYLRLQTIIPVEANLYYTNYDADEHTIRTPSYARLPFNNRIVPYIREKPRILFLSLQLDREVEEKRNLSYSQKEKINQVLLTQPIRLTFYCTEPTVTEPILIDVHINDKIKTIIDQLSSRLNLPTQHIVIEQQFKQTSNGFPWFTDPNATVFSAGWNATSRLLVRNTYVAPTRSTSLMRLIDGEQVSVCLVDQLWFKLDQLLQIPSHQLLERRKAIEQISQLMYTYPLYCERTHDEQLIRFGYNSSWRDIMEMAQQIIQNEQSSQNDQQTDENEQPQPCANKRSHDNHNCNEPTSESNEPSPTVKRQKVRPNG